MKMYLYLLPLLGAGFLSAADAEPVCEKCQRIRAYNAAHPENNYEFYDDYLKDQAKKQAQNNNTKPESKPSKDVAEAKPTPTKK